MDISSAFPFYSDMSSTFFLFYLFLFVFEFRVLFSFFFFGGVWISIFPNVYYTYTTRRIRITPNKTMAATVYLILFFP